MVLLRASSWDLPFLPAYKSGIPVNYFLPEDSGEAVQAAPLLPSLVGAALDDMNLEKPHSQSPGTAGGNNMGGLSAPPNPLSAPGQLASCGGGPSMAPQQMSKQWYRSVVTTCGHSVSSPKVEVAAAAAAVGGPLKKQRPAASAASAPAAPDEQLEDELADTAAAMANSPAPVGEDGGGDGAVQPWRSVRGQPAVATFACGGDAIENLEPCPASPARRLTDLGISAGVVGLDDHVPLAPGRWDTVFSQAPGFLPSTLVPAAPTAPTTSMGMVCVGPSFSRCSASSVNNHDHVGASPTGDSDGSMTSDSDCEAAQQQRRTSGPPAAGAAAAPAAAATPRRKVCAQEAPSKVGGPAPHTLATGPVAPRRRPAAAASTGAAALGLAPPTASRAGGSKRQADRIDKCRNCGNTETPQWRCGPEGPRTLCNACGVRHKKGLPMAYLEKKRKASQLEE